MTVKELIEVLSGFSPDKEVILQKDAEGNGYSPLAGADDDAVYVAETTYSGTVYSKDEKEEYAPNGEQVVVLWPTN